MNKMLVFPLAVMLLISMFISMVSVVYPEGTSDDFRNSDDISFTQESGKEVSPEYNIPGAQPETFNIWNAETGVMIILVVALTVGIVAGIKVLGSGLDDLSHKMIFNIIFYVSLWACLTVVARELMFNNVVTGFLWLVMTAMFAMGLMNVINGED